MTIGMHIGAVEEWYTSANPAPNSILVGVDSVGLGALAGPVVAAAVHLDIERAYQEGWLNQINDSKKLSPAKREELMELIVDASILGLHTARPKAVDIHGISYVDMGAMRGAVHKAFDTLDPSPYVVVDGARTITNLGMSQRTFVKGDQRSYHIAAASIVAKVTRDELMISYSKEYQPYGFDTNKGYGTKQHKAAIKQHGLCYLHRRTYKGCKEYAI